MANAGQDGTFPVLTPIIEQIAHVVAVEESVPYFSPVRFLPSIMTLLNIRFIRVW